MNDQIDKIKKVVEEQTGCAATHQKTVPVVETFRKRILWEGPVEVFELTSHPDTKLCYAWSYDEDGETHFVTALDIPPVFSAKSAVSMYISSLVRHRSDRGVKVT